MKGQEDQLRSKWDYSWFCSLSGLLPTSVALHVLRGLQQKLFIEYHRFTQRKWTNPSRPQRAVELCGSQTKSWGSQTLWSPLSCSVLIFTWVKGSEKIKPITSAILSKRLILPKILQKASVNPRRDNLFFFLNFLAKWDFLVSNFEEQDKKNSLKDLARHSKLNA